jgi:hypothetical protein
VEGRGSRGCLKSDFISWGMRTILAVYESRFRDVRGFDSGVVELPECQ